MTISFEVLMKKVGFLALLVVVSINCHAADSKETCGDKKYIEAEGKLAIAEKEMKKSSEPWKDLEAAFKYWDSCTHWFQDESFNDAIAELTSSRWDRISDLVEIRNKNPSFYKYIIRSLGNEIVGLIRSQKILSLSVKDCPKGASDVCKDIEKACK